MINVMTITKRLANNLHGLSTVSRLLFGAAIAAPSFLVATTSMAAADDKFGYGDHMSGVGTGWFIGGHVMMFVFLVLVIVLIVLAVRWIVDWNSGSGKNSALDILKERLARGDIEPAEYEERRKVLEK